MRTTRRYVLLVATLCALSGCGSEPADAPPSDAERQQALRDSAFGSLAEQMDRAAEVQELELERKRKIDEALEQAQ